MALKPKKQTPMQPGKTRISFTTAANYIERAFDLGRVEDAQMVNDPNDGSIHFLIPAKVWSRRMIEARLIPYFANKVVMGGRCRIEGLGMDWNAIHIEPIPSQQKGGMK